MQHSTAPAPRWRAAVAGAMVVVVIALFAWLAHSAVAGAASATPGAGSPAATQPYGAGNGSVRPAADGRGPCPKDRQGSGGSSSGQQPAPGQSESAPTTGL